MPSSIPYDDAPLAPPLATFQVYKKLPSKLKERTYSFLYTGKWTADSPNLMNALKDENISLYIAALGAMTHTYHYVLSPGNDYKADKYPHNAIKDIKKVRIEFK